MSKTLKPCKNFKKYQGLRVPKSECCVHCWSKWHHEEYIRLIESIPMKECYAEDMKRGPTFRLHESETPSDWEAPHKTIWNLFVLDKQGYMELVGVLAKRTYAVKLMKAITLAVRAKK